MNLKEIDMKETKLIKNINISKILNDMKTLNHEINIIAVKILKTIEYSEFLINEK